MTFFVSCFAAIALLLGLLASHRKASVRSTGRFFLGFLFALSLAATLAILYGAFALASKGGGVLTFFAVPSGIVAWITGYMYFGTRKDEQYFDLSTEEKIRHNLAQHGETVANLRASIAKKTAARNKLFVSHGQRDRLRREIEREQELLQRLSLLRGALEQPETYAGDQS
jgi:hypothetical protein